jgi:hypothetical protein
MKKYLPFVLLSLVTLVINAQNLAILDEDGNNISNSTYHIDILPSSPTISHNFGVENTSNMDIPVNSVRYEDECTAGSGEFYCWSLCLPPQTCGTNYERGMPIFLEVIANTVSPAPLAIDFDPSFGSDEDGLEGTASYTYVLFDDNNPSDSVYVKVIYNISYAVGINEISENAISNVYPNPAQSQIQFDLNTNIDQAQFEIYSLVGQRVKQVNIENAQGKISIDIDDMVPGVYFLSEKNSSVTRRFIVSR